jgi:hypothetical protein
VKTTPAEQWRVSRLLRAGEARAAMAHAPSQPAAVVVAGGPHDDGEADADEGEAPVAPTPLRPQAPLPPGPAPFGGVRLVPAPPSSDD